MPGATMVMPSPKQPVRLKQPTSSPTLPPTNGFPAAAWDKEVYTHIQYMTGHNYIVIYMYM